MLQNLTIEAKWKELVVVACDCGSFSIDFTMGTPRVYFPDEASFGNVAPQWAVGHWNQIHDALKDWCTSNSIPLNVVSNGNVYTV